MDLIRLFRNKWYFRRNYSLVSTLSKPYILVLFLLLFTASSMTDISQTNGMQIAGTCCDAGLPGRSSHLPVSQQIRLIFGQITSPSPRSLILRHFPTGLCSNRIIFKSLCPLYSPHFNNNNNKNHKRIAANLAI